jgi:hypothetical protein
LAALAAFSRSESCDRDTPKVFSHALHGVSSSGNDGNREISFFSCATLTASRKISFSNVFLPSTPLQLPDLLLQGQDLGFRDHLVIRPNGLFPAFAHTAPPTKDQTGGYTMTAGYIGNRHSRLRRFLHNRHLLLCGIPAAALDPGKHFDSISIVRHSRNTRRTPSSYLGDCVRFKWGLLQGGRRISNGLALRR